MAATAAAAVAPIKPAEELALQPPAALEPRPLAPVDAAVGARAPAGAVISAAVFLTSFAHYVAYLAPVRAPRGRSGAVQHRAAAALF